MDSDSKRSSKDILRLLLHEERATQELHRLLRLATEQLKSESQRADAAERRAKDVLAHTLKLNDDRIRALSDATKAKEELKLYKMQYDLAQKEILRAQEVVRVLEEQRNTAEEDAAKARSTVRKMTLEKDVAAAREEGRREGMRKGIETGKEIGYRQGRATGYAHARGRLDQVDEEPLAEEPLPDAEGAALAEEDVPPTVPEPVPELPPIRPIPVREPPPSPRHPPAFIPPDNWIPQSDGQVIRLPPPHEMSSIIPRISTPVEEAPPPPVATQRPESAASVTKSSTSTPRKRRSRRHSSPESSSTSTSQLDMLSAPARAATRVSSGTPLSDIQEVLSTQASPNPTREGSLRSPRESVLQVKTPTPRSSVVHINNLEERASQAGPYNRPHLSADSSDSDDIARSPVHSLPPSDRRTSTSSNSTIGITVVPPSRRHSASDQILDPGTQYGGFLSPAHAHRPLPIPDPAREVSPVYEPQPIPEPVTIVLQDEHLPPGFIQTGPYTPSSSPLPSMGAVPPPPTLSPINAFVVNPPLPSPFMSPQNANAVVNGASTTTNPTVDPRSKRRNKKGKRGAELAKQLGPADSDDQEEVSSSLSSDRDTLTTPPAGHSRLSDDPPVIPPDPAMPSTGKNATKNRRRKGKR